MQNDADRTILVQRFEIDVEVDFKESASWDCKVFVVSAETVEFRQDARGVLPRAQSGVGALSPRRRILNLRM